MREALKTEGICKKNVFRMNLWVKGSIQGGVWPPVIVPPQT